MPRENRLAKEKSPYLLQHKGNPVDWYPWGEEAFKAAREQNKPIFLSIGYSTCYWCHMMEKDSFELPEVADALNRDFISIKVDREEHPDVDRIYMEAVIGMTGHGGWPMSVFLTPDLKPFFGATFFWRAQFVDLLSRISQAWKTEPEKVRGAGDQIFAHLSRKEPVAGQGTIQTELLREAFRELQQGFDPTHGGFGPAPKFPHSMGISLLLRIHRRTGNKEALEMATKSLDGMAEGGIYDRIGGGFHRYATREDWNEPHYEKMLYDNALLAVTYLEAFQITQKGRYAEVVRQTFDYILREMTDPDGGFWSAQDAGEVGKEGDYYRLNEEERAKHEPPHKDDKVLTSWNGLMIAALAKGYRVLGDERYLAAAQRAANFIRKNLYKNDKLLRRYRDGDARYHGTLDDYAFLIHGLLALYESDFDRAWLNWAIELQKQQDNDFRDESGGCFFTAPDEKQLIVRGKETNDGATPSGNSIAALNLLRLHGLTYERKYLERADRLFGFLAGFLAKYPAGYAQALIAADYRLDRSKEVVVVGKVNDPKLKEAVGKIYQMFLPSKVLISGEVSGKPMINNQTTFYICENQTCKLPTTDWEKAKELLEVMEKYDL